MESIGQLLQRDIDVDVTIEVDAALRKLSALGLVEKSEAGHGAVPLPQAIALLDAVWNNALKSEPAAKAEMRPRSRDTLAVHVASRGESLP